MAGNNAALLAVPWLGMLTGLLGNLSLLSYFCEEEGNGRNCCADFGGDIYLYRDLAACFGRSHASLLNLLNYFNWLNPRIWRLWEDFITVGGLSVLPQVMLSTFVPIISQSILPGIISFTMEILAVYLACSGQLSENGVKFVNSTSGWTAAQLFMWMPVAQMWTNFLNPENIKGLSSFTMLLAMIGNGLMLPRPLFIRDLMRFTGSCWASFLYGWGNLLCMYWNRLWKDTKAYGYSSLHIIKGAGN